MNKERNLLALVGMFGVIAVGVALFFLSSQEGPETDPVVAAEEEQPELDRDIRNIDDDTVRSVIHTETSEPEVEIGGPPPSYRKALGKVIGRVVEENLDPIAGLPIEAISLSASSVLPDAASMFDLSWTLDSFVGASAKSNEEGRFELTGLEPRGVHVLGFDLGGGRAGIRILDQVPGPGEVVDLGDIILGPYVTFTGQVVDPTGAPVAGARVRVTDVPVIVFVSGVQDYRSGDSIYIGEGGLKEVFEIPSAVASLERKLPVPTTLTDAEGLFRLEGVPIGLVTVVADHQDFVTVHQGPIPSGRSGEKDVGQIVLDPGVSLVGQVIDTAGRPVAGAEVLAGNRLSVADVGLMHPCGVTDEEGRFQADALRPGPAYAVARRGRGQSWVTSPAVSAGADEVTLVLPANFNLTMRTLGPEGEPVDAGLRVRMSKGGPMGNDMPAFLDTPIRTESGLVRSEPGVYVFEKVAPGPYKIRAHAPGYIVAETQVSMTEADQTFDIAFEREVVGEVLVVDDKTDRPVEHAKVAAWRDDDHFLATETTWSRTDESGKARLKGLGVGSFKIAVEHPAYAMVGGEIALPGEAVTMRLVAGGVVEGMILKGGEPPIEPLAIGLGPRGSGGPGQGGFMPRMRVTDPTGYFRIENVDPGEYEVAVFDRLLNKGTMSLVEMIEGGPLKEARIEVFGGEITRVDMDILAEELIEGPTAYLRGHLLINGLPAEGYRVVMSGRKRRGMTTDENGSFDFGKVPAGKTRLRVRPEGSEGLMMAGEMFRHSIELEKGEVRSETIEFRVGALRGNVLRSDGLASVGVPVSVRGRNADGKRIGGSMATITDNQGEFSFPLLPEGEYTIETQDAGHAEGHAVVDVRSGSTENTVLIRLVAEVAVAGRLELEGASMEDIEWVWLQFRSEDGQNVGDADVDLENLTFTASGLSPGNYQVTVRSGKRRYLPVDIVVPPGGDENLLIATQRPQAKYSGKVEIANLDPVPKTMMLIFYDASKYEGGRDEPAGWSSVDGDDMAFVVEGLDRGRYKVICFAAGREIGPIDVRVPDGEKTDAVLRFK